YGEPHDDSDVDILVVMPARNEIDQAIRIDRVVDPLFPLDLLVCTPKNLAWRLKEGDSFLREIMTKGKVLYEKADGQVGAQGDGWHALRYSEGRGSSSDCHALRSTSGRATLPLPVTLDDHPFSAAFPRCVLNDHLAVWQLLLQLFQSRPPSHGLIGSAA